MRKFIVLSMLFAFSFAALATDLVWEAESPTKGGSVFKSESLTRDPSNKISDNKVLSIPKVPKGEKPPTDEVTYTISVPSDGTYYLWARVRWSTGCGNSFLIGMSGVFTGNIIIGGDATYNSLHWVQLKDGNRAKKLSLKKGKQDITLATKETGSAMCDQFLLTTDANKKPSGILTATKSLVD